MRDMFEAGFEIALVQDAVAGGRNEEGDGYQSAMVLYRYIAERGVDDRGGRGAPGGAAAS